MLLIGNLLLLTGLLLATVGGIFLAYDATHGAGAEFQAEVAATQLKTLKILRAEVQEIYRGLSSYTEDERNSLLAEEEKKHGPEERTLADRADSIKKDYATKVAELALRGIRFLIIAFVFQFIGTLLIALQSGAIHL